VGVKEGSGDTSVAIAVAVGDEVADGGASMTGVGVSLGIVVDRPAAVHATVSAIEAAQAANRRIPHLMISPSYCGKTVRIPHQPCLRTEQGACTSMILTGWILSREIARTLQISVLPM